MKRLALRLIGGLFAFCFCAFIWSTSANEWKSTKHSLRPSANPGLSIELSTPWLKLSEPAEVAIRLDSSEGAWHLNQGVVRSLATGDFDDDGVPDLVTGYSLQSTGVITWQRGNVDALYPNSAEALRRKANGQFINAPFIPEARILKLSAPPDYLAAGDFDGDGHLDLVTTTQASRALLFLRGNGHGGFAEPKQVVLPGKVSALATGEVNRRDGLTDILVGVVADDGSSQLLIFESAAGALNAAPESVMLEAPVKSIAVGQLDDGFEMDIAVAAGNQVVLLKGRDRHTSLGEESRAEVISVEISRAVFDVGVASVAVGDFLGDYREEIAFLTDAGAVHVMERGEKLVASVENQTDKTIDALALWQINYEATAGVGVVTSSIQNSPLQKLISANLSSLAKADLIVIDENNRQVHTLTSEPVNTKEEGYENAAMVTSDRRLMAASLTMESEPLAVLPMRLNSSALQSLVVSKNDGKPPALMQAQAASTITVNSNLVSNTRDTVLTLNEAIRVANGTLAVSSLTSQEQAQISGTPATPGLDAIHFNIPGGGVPLITDSLLIPTITDAVIIDGTTQATGRVAIESPGAQAVLRITAGNSTIRGMVLNRGCRGIHLTTNGSNVIEGNFIGTSTDGQTAGAGNSCNQIELGDSANNTIGGTTAAARNILSGSLQPNNTTGILLNGPNATGNSIVGNYIGPDVTGNVVIGNANHGIFIASSTNINNTIGGTTAGAGNLISGNGRDDIGGQGGIVVSAAGQLIQGNVIGLNKDGTAALASASVGIRVNAVANVTIGGTSPAARNIISGNGTGGLASHGIVFQAFGVTNCLIQGNYIGTNATGTAAIRNLGHGIFVPGGSNNNSIGGAVSGAGNIISGNILDGVNLTFTSGLASSTGNLVQGNYIGTDITGTLAIGNQGDGIEIQSSVLGTLIGGTSATTRNVISGNRENGISILGNAQSNPNRIEGNYIGTNTFGTGALANGQSGIFFSGNRDGHTIGGSAQGTGNVIAFNAGAGVASDTGRVIGGPVLGNSIFSNGGLGIDRENNGPSPVVNTRSDNAPVLTSVSTSGNTTTISGTLQQNHTTSVNYVVQFFSNLSCDPSGFGEGKTFIGQTTVNITNATAVSFTANITPAVPGGQFVTAVAIGPSADPLILFTSEFSPCTQVLDVTPTPTPTPTPSVSPSPTPTPTPTPPQIFVIAPNKGGNAGSVTSRISGAGFRPGVSILLRQSGSPDILGGMVRVSENGATVNVTFDLLGKAPGVYDLVVTNTDSSKATLQNAFTIEQGGGPSVWADFAGRSINRVNTNSRFFIMAGNRGNTDAYMVPVFLSGLPNSAIVTTQFPVLTPPQIPGADPVDYNAIPILSGDETGQVVPVIVPRLRPGQTIALPIIVSLPDTVDATLTVHAAKPMVSSVSFAPSSSTQALHSERSVIANIPNDAISDNSQLINCLMAILKFAATEALGALLGDDCADTVKDILLNQLPNFLGNAVSIAAADDGVGEAFGFTQTFTQVLQVGLKSALCAANIVLPQAALVKLVLKITNIAALIQSGIEVCDACFNNFCSDHLFRVPLRWVTSNDPNDKVGAVGSGSEHFITGTSPIPYTIFFENLDTATAPAQKVVITDQLDTSKFDLSTFRFGGVFFGNTQVDVPQVHDTFTLDKDLRPGVNLIARINGVLNQSTGLVTWTFNSIDPQTGLPTDDPLAGFLPPNKNSPEGSGAVLFTIAPKSGLIAGDQIRNSARIIFDSNAPIDTPDWLNTIDNSRPTSHVAPLNATQPFIVFDVNWSGTDTGSGVQSYTVFVSENGGAFKVWLQTTFTSGIFVGRPGKTYSFYTIARDGAGNEETVKTTAEAATTTPTAVSNSIDDPRFFVAQHYRDFLNRNPESSGLNFWTNEITSCATQQCIEVKRINVSAAFFLAIEFQETGYLVYRTHQAAFGVGPLLRRSDFLIDSLEIAKGVVVLAPGWQDVLEENKRRYFDGFVQRPEFLLLYPTSMTAQQFVDTLNANTLDPLNAGLGGSLSQAERDALINGLQTGTLSRAQVLRRVVEDTDFNQREFNRAFVLMQYFGYLRRNPNDAPDNNMAGYDFWLAKLNQFGGNFVQAEMVKAFILSLEYRSRFGP